MILQAGGETGLLQFGLMLAACGFLAAGIFRFTVIQAKLSSFLHPRTESHRTTIQVDTDGLERLESSLNVGAIAVGVLIPILIISVFGTPEGPRQRDPSLPFLRLVFVGGGLLLAAALAAAWALMPFAKKLASARAGRFAREFEAAASRLSEIELKIEALVSHVSLPAPPSHMSALADVFSQRAASFVDFGSRNENTEAEDIFAAAYKDFEETTRVSGSLEQIRRLHKDATEAVAASRFYSLGVAVDEILAFTYSDHLSEMMISREYEDILSQFAGVKDELEGIIQKANSVGAPSSSSGSSADIWDESICFSSGDQDSIWIALSRLTAKQGDPPERLRRLYKGLAKIYNTDQNHDGDSRRLQQIIEAYQFLKKENLAA